MASLPALGIFNNVNDILQQDINYSNIRLGNQTISGFDFHFVNKDTAQSPNSAAAMYPKFFVFIFVLIIKYKQHGLIFLD